MDIDIPDTLEKLGDLLEFGWCQKTYARDKFGDPIDLHSDDATSFCLVGGARHLAGRVCAPLILRALCSQMDLPAPSSPNGYSPELTEWNDFEGRTKVQVVELVRDTAKDVRAQT